MFQNYLGFENLWYLWLLVLIPFIWILSFQSLAGLGRFRRIVVLTLRSICIFLLVAALAEAQHMRISNKVTVIYLLDQSRSIPANQRHEMLRYVADEVSKHRQDERGDEAGVIIFGREALIEIPPFDDDIQTSTLESAFDLRADATNLAAALKLAHASFPEGTAKRIVIISDGNENLGNARALLPGLANDDIGLDVVPITLDTRAEIIVDKVTLPSDIRKGQPVQAQVVITNHSQKTSEDDDGIVRGRLRFSRIVGRQKVLLGNQEHEVQLKPGKNVFYMPDTIDKSDVYTYEAEFIPDEPEDDLMLENNVATAFTHVRGKGRVLLIEDWENPGEFQRMVDALGRNEIEVVVQQSNNLFASMAELQGFDSVILANVPRVSGNSANDISGFTDDQINMLIRNTDKLGAGMIMLGGPKSFGAGGWSNSKIEEAMPIDFQVKNDKVEAVGALVMMMHASEMANGNHWQKVIAREALNLLGPSDYCGIVHWNNFGGDDWLWAKDESGLVRVGERKRIMLAKLNRMTPGDMPQFQPGMVKALESFKKVPASLKHMIIISDGDPSPPSPRLISDYVKANVKITTVAVGTHGGIANNPLEQIATDTGGKFYNVRNPKMLPKIYQKVTMQVARPLIKDPIYERPIREQPHEILDGITGDLPHIKGYVQSSIKTSPLVERPLYMNDKVDDTSLTSLMACWNYGAGRTVAFTTDAGIRWADDWTSWENYDRFFTQMVRWSMRPISDNGKFSVATDIKDGKVRVVVSALDKDDEFLNMLNMQAVVVDPNLERPFDLAIEQVAPGRYVGEFEATQAGSYFVNIIPGQTTDEKGNLRNRAPIIAGLNVPYSAEFREQETNLNLLKTIASTKPRNGDVGAVIEPDQLARDEGIHTFRHTLQRAFSSEDMWPLFILMAACAFFADVFVRRVQIGFEWVEPCKVWIRRKFSGEPVSEEATERMERLRSQKAAVNTTIDQRRAAARFEPEVDDDAASLTEVLDDVSSASTPSERQPQRTQQESTPEDEDNYTSRLLEAKKKAWKDKQQ